MRIQVLHTLLVGWSFLLFVSAIPNPIDTIYRLSSMCVSFLDAASPRVYLMF